MDFIIQNILNALQWGSFYALIALGYTLVYGVLRLINFAHGDVFMVGAYIAFFVAGFLLGPAVGLSPMVTFLLAVPLTMFLTACVGVTLERVAYRPLRRKGGTPALRCHHSTHVRTDPRILQPGSTRCQSAEISRTGREVHMEYGRRHHHQPQSDRHCGRDSRIHIPEFHRHQDENRHGHARHFL